METWGTEDVVKRLEDVTDPKTVNLVKDRGLTGKELISITLENFMKIVPKETKCKYIMTERDEFNENEKESLKTKASSEDCGHETQQTSLTEPFREFDRHDDITDSYQQYASFPTAPSRPANMIEPVRRFVSMNIIDTNGPKFEKLTSEVVKFGAACLNDCTNGVIHFGVKNRKIIGVTVKCDKMLLDKCLTQQIKKCFHESQVDTVLKCIRPIRWVQVISKERSLPKFVMEVVVEPVANLCGDNAYFVHSSKDLYRFGEDSPSVVSWEKCLNFFKERERLVECRKLREKEYRRRRK